MTQVPGVQVCESSSREGGVGLRVQGLLLEPLPGKPRGEESGGGTGEDTESRGAAGGGGGKTKGKAPERGGRWEGVAPGGSAGRPAGRNHRPSSGA